jgi:hypothetical protein
MANRSDRPDVHDHDGSADDVDGAGRDDGPAGSATRYKQVRRRGGAGPDEAVAPGAVADTNRMKRTRRSSTTSGATRSTTTGPTGSTDAGATVPAASGKRVGTKAAGGKTTSGKTTTGKAIAGKATAGKTTSAQSRSGRSAASDATDTEPAESDAPAKATAEVSTRKSDVSTKWAVDRLDPRERRISFAAAGAAVLFGITIYISETHDKNFHLSKNQLAPEWTLILGIAAGALLLGATFLGRRAPVGFVALFAGAMFTGSSIAFGLPFIAVALWILYRSYKVQKEMSANVRAARAESRSQSTGSRATGPSGRGSAAATRGAKGTTKAKGPAMPEGNKRYTPKRPPPPPPKPSRRERKATQPSD